MKHSIVKNRDECDERSTGLIPIMEHVPQLLYTLNLPSLWALSLIITRGYVKINFPLPAHFKHSLPNEQIFLVIKKLIFIILDEKSVKVI